MMTDRAEQRLHDIMQDAAAHVDHAPTTIEGKVGAFYKAFMDEARIEELGAKPIARDLQNVRVGANRGALAGLMGLATHNFEGTLFGVGIDVDLKDPNKYALYIGQAGLGLPDRDYYLKADFAATKAKYQAHIAAVLKLIGWPEAEVTALFLKQ